MDIMNRTLKVLRIPKATEELSRVSEELCADSIRNLAFLSRCFAVNDLRWNRSQESNNDDDNDGANEHDITAHYDQDSDAEFEGFSPSLEDRPTALDQLLSRLVALFRQETWIMRLEALYSKTAVLALLHSLCSTLPVPSLTPSLQAILAPLLTLIDPATTVPHSSDSAFNEAYKALIDKSQEILAALQKRLGTTTYVAQVSEVQKGIRDRREGRRAKRRVEAISMPEKFGKEKRRRHDVKRVRKKERGNEARGMRRGW